MKFLINFKGFKPGIDLKNFIYSKLNKFKRFLHSQEEKEETLFKVEIEKTEEVEPKRGAFKTEIHYQPIGHQEVNVKSQDKEAKKSFLKAFRKLKQNVLKLHHKFHKRR